MPPVLLLGGLALLLAILGSSSKKKGAPAPAPTPTPAPGPGKRPVVYYPPAVIPSPAPAPAPAPSPTTVGPDVPGGGQLGTCGTDGELQNANDRTLVDNLIANSNDPAQLGQIADALHAANPECSAAEARARAKAAALGPQTYVIAAGVVPSKLAEAWTGDPSQWPALVDPAVNTGLSRVRIWHAFHESTQNPDGSPGGAGEQDVSYDVTRPDADGPPPATRDNADGTRTTISWSNTGEGIVPWQVAQTVNIPPTWVSAYVAANGYSPGRPAGF
jgi:hypothetical protein